MFTYLLDARSVSVPAGKIILPAVFEREREREREPHLNTTQD